MGLNLATEKHGGEALESPRQEDVGSEMLVFWVEERMRSPHFKHVTENNRWNGLHGSTTDSGPD